MFPVVARGMQQAFHDVAGVGLNRKLASYIEAARREISGGTSATPMIVHMRFIGPSAANVRHERRLEANPNDPIAPAYAPNNRLLNDPNSLATRNSSKRLA
jgi:hypothetical protein